MRVEAPGATPQQVAAIVAALQVYGADADEPPEPTPRRWARREDDAADWESLRLRRRRGSPR